MRSKRVLGMFDWQAHRGDVQRSVPRSRRNMRHKEGEFAEGGCAGLDRAGIDLAMARGDIVPLKGKPAPGTAERTPRGGWGRWC